MDIQCLQKVTQALEARAVANPPHVILKKSVVTVLAPEVSVHHVGDVANASPQRWVVEDIDDRTRRIRHIYSSPRFMLWGGSVTLKANGTPPRNRYEPLLPSASRSTAVKTAPAHADALDRQTFRQR